MQPFRCGCPVAPRGISDYCPAHWLLSCHNPAETTLREGECPPCFRARMASVSLDAALDSLAKVRTRPGIPPHIRLADKDEFDPSTRLTQHSKVREKRETL